MKHTNRKHGLWSTCALAGVMLTIIALLPSAQAQTVTVTSALVERIDGLQSQINDLRGLIDAGQDDSPAPEPNPPAPSAGKIGMNSGFVWRSNFTHPDRPGIGNYDELLRPVCSVYRPMNWNRINDFRTEVDSIDDPHSYDGRTWRDALREQVGVCNAVGAGAGDAGVRARSGRVYPRQPAG